MREQQGLPDDFDINGYDNLVPACFACNGKKSAHNLRAGRIGIELANARRLKRQVEALVARFVKQSEAESVRFLIAEALSAGRLSQADVRDMIGAGWVSPRLLGEPESLFSGINLQAINDQDIARLKNTKTGPDDGVHMEAMAGDRQATVYTIAEYEAAIANGMCACTTYTMSMAFMWFERPRRILNILQTAQFADESYIRSPRHGVCDIALLPATLLFCGLYESQEDFQRDQAVLIGKTVQDLVLAQEARIEQVDAYSVTVIWGDCRTFLMELMRADVDGDGVEDLVISWGGKLVEGTYREAGIMCLRRLSDEGLFEVAELT